MIDMAEKKYYWLRLQRDFFKRHDIRIIEEMENGKDYLLFYLKLLVESIDHEGNLRFSDTVPYNDKMLAVVTNTNVDIVRSALLVFEQLKMIEVLEDETIYMSEVEKMIGTYSQDEHTRESTRLRVQAHRERAKQADVLQKRYSNVTCNGEIEKDIEIDKEKEIEINKKDINTSCVEPNKLATPQPPVITLILNDKSEYGVTQKDIDEYTELYPGANVMQELRNMKGWCISNPTRRKTKSGIKRFITNWLSKAQNQGGGNEKKGDWFK